MIYTSHLLEDDEMKELIRETGTGVESIEFSIAENLDELDRKMKLYEKRLEAMECKKLFLHGPFLDLNPMTFDSLILETTRKRYEQAYEAAKYLGAKKIVFHTCYVPGVYMLYGWADRVADFYNRFLEGKEGVQILMENVFDQNPQPILEAAEKITHPDFGLCFDMGHAHCYSPVPTVNWCRLFGEKIRHLHVHDNMGDRDAHMGLGMGNLDYKAIIEEVKRNNPDVTYTIECMKKEDVERSICELNKIIYK